MAIKINEIRIDVEHPDHSAGVGGFVQAYVASPADLDNLTCMWATGDYENNGFSPFLVWKDDDGRDVPRPWYAPLVESALRAFLIARDEMENSG